MSKRSILQNGNHLAEINFYSGNEFSFEDKCLTLLPLIIKNLIDVECDCFRYKQKLTNLVYGNMEPDLMVIAKDYSFWAIVEVETMDYNNLSRKLRDHALEQLRSLATSHPTKENIYKYINEKNPSLNIKKSKFTEMQMHVPPEFICMTNIFSDEWQNALYPLGVWLISATEYRNMIDLSDVNLNAFHVSIGDNARPKEKLRTEWKHFFFQVTDKKFKQYFKHKQRYKINLNDHCFTFIAGVKDEILRLKPDGNENFNNIVKSVDKENINQLVINYSSMSFRKI